MSLTRLLLGATALAVSAATAEAQQTAQCAQKVDSTWYDKAKARVSNILTPARVDTVYLACPLTQKPKTPPKPQAQPPRRPAVKPSVAVPVSKDWPEYTMQITVRGRTDTSLTVNEHDRPLIPVHFGDNIYITGKGTRLRNCTVSGLDETTKDFLQSYTPQDTVITFGAETALANYDTRLRLDCDDLDAAGKLRNRTPRDRRAFFYLARDIVPVDTQRTVPLRTQPEAPRDTTPKTAPPKPKKPMAIPSRFVNAYAGLGYTWQNQQVTNMTGDVSSEHLSAPLQTIGASYMDKRFGFNAKASAYNYSGQEVSPSHMTTDMHTNVREFNAFGSLGYIGVVAGELGQRKLSTTENFTLAIPGQPVIKTAENTNATTTQAALGAGFNVPWRFGRIVVAGMAARQTDNSGRAGADAANGYVGRGMVEGMIRTPWLNGKPLPFELNARFFNYEGGVVANTSNNYANSGLELGLTYSILPHVRIGMDFQNQTITDAEPLKTSKAYRLTGQIGW